MVEETLSELRRRYRAEGLADHIERLLADAPPATEAQRATLSRLLTGVAESPRGGVPHDHSTYVDGCFRCDLNRDELGVE